VKRVLFAITGTVLGLVALLSFKSHAHPLGAVPGGLPAASASSPHATVRTPPATTTSAPPRGGPATRSSSAATATKYVGQAVQTYYGVVQVAVTVSGSHLDSVKFVKLTAYDGTSQQINQYAAQILLNETMSAQSAHIDAVSGATYTSDGYIQSLQSALDQAGIQ
jgi:uncharacterized protein with FMN-binding domain